MSCLSTAVSKALLPVKMLQEVSLCFVKGEQYFLLLTLYLLAKCQSPGLPFLPAVIQHNDWLFSIVIWLIIFAEGVPWRYGKQDILTFQKIAIKSILLILKISMKCSHLHSDLILDKWLWLQYFLSIQDLVWRQLRQFESGFSGCFYGALPTYLSVSFVFRSVEL